MTLKRLMIILGILVVLAGCGIAWLWQYAYSPQGRARVIIAQLKGDTTSLRGWMLHTKKSLTASPQTNAPCSGWRPNVILSQRQDAGWLGYFGYRLVELSCRLLC
jgi:hypothetical protein